MAPLNLAGSPLPFFLLAPADLLRCCGWPCYSLLTGREAKRVPCLKQQFILPDDHESVAGSSTNQQQGVRVGGKGQGAHKGTCKIKGAIMHSTSAVNSVSPYISPWATRLLALQQGAWQPEESLTLRNYLPQTAKANKIDFSHRNLPLNSGFLFCFFTFQSAIELFPQDIQLLKKKKKRQFPEGKHSDQKISDQLMAACSLKSLSNNTLH